MSETIRVTVWNEGIHEKRSPKVAAIYPFGIHGAIAEGLRLYPDFQVRTATQEEDEHGLTEEVLQQTDVLTWWGHLAHKDVRDDVVERVYRRVVSDGMGLIVLHSGHHSKLFRKLTGTSADLKWREHERENERIWIIDPSHPVSAGLPQWIDIEREEMYGERFDIPQPDHLVMISWFKGGEVFRSGCCFHRGQGKIFYFRPGHETFPTYYHAQVRQVIANAVRWARLSAVEQPYYGNFQPLEKLD
jgi:trehalose utilization protein